MSRSFLHYRCETGLGLNRIRFCNGVTLPLHVLQNADIATLLDLANMNICRYVGSSRGDCNRAGELMQYVAINCVLWEEGNGSLPPYNLYRDVLAKHPGILAVRVRWLTE